MTCLFISLWEVFSTPDCLGASWAQSTTSQSSPPAMSAPKASADLRKMTKEEMRALEGEKDVDSLEEVEKKYEQVEYYVDEGDFGFVEVGWQADCSRVRNFFQGRERRW